jgi:mannitol-1-phosphate 5-dehydrogenase
VALTGPRTFVGFGLGPIQTGLFLFEAFSSGAFGRLVVAEVVPALVGGVRDAGGWLSVNVARRDRVEVAVIGPVEIADPGSDADRRLLVRAVAEAGEIATAVPSVDRYVSPQPGSVHRMLAAGLLEKATRGGPPAVVYAAENHNHAAEILEARVLAEIPAGDRASVSARVQFLNTVIGKMSRVVTDRDEVRGNALVPVTPALPQAFLVESFNRILISRIRLGGTFARGIAAFEEKEDLLPFEEAKLYGHNATHALGGYLGALGGARRMAELDSVPGLRPLLRAAFLEESGAALIRRHRGIDPLFTFEGYREYADDLLERMTNPFLLDTVERVTRDTERKLGWNDRLIGTIRVALASAVEPRRYALGAAAAVAAVDPRVLEPDPPVATLLGPLWEPAAPDAAEREAVLARVERARAELRAWRASGLDLPPGLL